MNKLLKIFTIICVLFYSTRARRECVHRDYGNGATVCVCNITYCDDLNPIPVTGRGVATLFETSVAGDRFRETALAFNQTTPVDVPLTQTVTVDRSRAYQTIIGFGGAFTDSAGINLASLPASMQITAMADYYSPAGIEYTIGRVPIAGCDFSTYPYTYDDVPDDDNLTHFSLTRDDMLYKIPYLQIAQSVSGHTLKYFGSPWSSPAWMKTTGTLNHGGVLIGQPGGKYYQIWANYFVKFLEAYEKRGVHIWGLTVENEPGQGFNPNHTFNDLGFTAATERDFIKLNLGPTLEKAGYGRDRLRLMSYDDQRTNKILNWTDTVLGDPEAAKYVAGIAFHWYWNTDDNVGNLDDTHAAHPDHFILATEACEDWEGRSAHVSLGNWAAFERYAHDIISDLNHWTAGWVDWNLALDLEGGPNWVSNFVDAPIIVNASAYEYYKQPFFYALGHFSKFLTPDSVRVKLTETRKVDNFETTAFVQPDNATVVIALNRNNLPLELTIVDPLNGKLVRVVKPRSMQTYIWYN